MPVRRRRYKRQFFWQNVKWPDQCRQPAGQQSNHRQRSSQADILCLTINFGDYLGQFRRQRRAVAGKCARSRLRRQDEARSSKPEIVFKPPSTICRVERPSLALRTPCDKTLTSLRKAISNCQSGSVVARFVDTKT